MIGGRHTSPNIHTYVTDFDFDWTDFNKRKKG